MPGMPDRLASLTSALAAAAASLGADAPDAALERPADADHGDYATTLALRLAKDLRRPPREIAEALAVAARASDGVATAEIAGPGFVNLRLAAGWFRDALRDVQASGDAYGRPDRRTERVLVELVSANPTGDLTVGSARNGVYGDAVARILAFAGDDVVREYYFNDAGVQMQRLGASIRALRAGEDVPEGGYGGAAVVAIAPTLDVPDGADDATIAQLATEPMFARIRATLTATRIDVDVWVSERELHQSGGVVGAVERARAQGDVYEHEGATWLATTRYGDDKDRVVFKADGSAAYFAADLAYLDHKFARGFDRIIYVLGADHHGYAGRLKAAAACLGYDPDRVEIAIYQMITISGERMGKRRGNVVDLDELLEAIGVDATRFYLVQRSHDQPLDIDVEQAVAASRDNPVYYVQYAHARAVSILRRAGDPDTALATTNAHEPERQERDVVKRLVEWPSVVAEAAERRAPHRIVAYLIALAGEFHAFHHDLRVLHDDPEVRAFRLALTAAVRDVVKLGLGLLAVDAPDEM